MKIIIEHNLTKRQIDGAFNICGSRDDLKLVAGQILNGCRDEIFAYGWVKISPMIQPSLVDTKPEAWD